MSQLDIYFPTTDLTEAEIKNTEKIEKYRDLILQLRNKYYICST